MKADHPRVQADHAPMEDEHSKLEMQHLQPAAQQFDAIAKHLKTTVSVKLGSPLGSFAAKS